MSYEKVQQADEKVIGLKQTIQWIEHGQADEVFIAEDIEPHIKHKLHLSCEKHKVPITYVDSKKLLGKTCGIDVGAATVAIKR